MSAAAAVVFRADHVLGLVCVLFFLTLTQTPFAASVQDLQDQERKLEQVRDRLQELQKSVRRDEARAGAASRELRETEKAMARINRQLASLDRDLEKQDQRLHSLHARFKKERRRMEQLQATLAVHVRSAYAMGRQGQLKLLLSQEDPAIVSRVLTYFRYLGEARANGIRVAADQLLELDALKKAIVKQQVEMEALRERRKEEAAKLAQTQQARESALLALRHEISRKGQEMERLKNNEQELQQLIDTLSEELAAAPVFPNEELPFGERRGQLQWPVAGHLTTRYGQKRKVGQLTWRGVLVSAPEGSDVRAVSQGQVVFADWFRGFGLLVIVDHGDEYMSLYGYNQVLHKEVGDWVGTGEVISKVGVTGGRQAAGLYFELRHRGRPVNPMTWLEGLPAQERASR